MHVSRGGGGSREGENGAQNGAVLIRGSPESTRNSPFLTPNSPLLTQIGPKKPGSDRGWLGGAWGGIFWGKGGVGVGSDSFGRREIFGLLNFCCTREACFIWEVFSVSHPRLACRLGRFAAERHRRSLTPPPTHTLFAKRGLRWRGRGRLFYTSHFKGGAGAPPLEPLHSKPGLSALGGCEGGGAPPRRGVARGPFPLRGDTKGGLSPFENTTQGKLPTPYPLP